MPGDGVTRTSDAGAVAARDTNGEIMQRRELLRLGLAAVLVLSGCATTPGGGDGGAERAAGRAPGGNAITQEPQAEDRAREGGSESAPQTADTGGESEVTDDAQQGLETRIYRGSGQMIDATAFGQSRRLASGEVVLNFENTPVREAIQAVLGDILGENYAIAPGVDARLSLQTSRPLTRDAVLPTFERVLHMHGIALVRDDQNDLWRVMRLQDAAQSGVRLRLGRSGQEVPAGYQVRVVPLEYIAAAEMKKILSPMVTPGTSIQTDAVRNLLIITAASGDMNAFLETVDIFDVDLLEGMSVGVFNVDNAEPTTIAEELGRLTGADAEGPLAGIFRVIPVDRLGAVLVVTPQPQYLEAAREWVERLDRTSEDAQQRRVFVHRLENTDAPDIARVINELYGVSVGTAGDRQDSGRSRLGRDADVAEGLRSTSLGGGSGGAQSGLGNDRNARSDDREAVTGNGDNGGSTSRGLEDGLGIGGTGGTGSANGDGDGNRNGLGNVRVVADGTNNSLVILATGAEYEQLREVIEELDIEPLQVLVDATIVEVTLSDQLEYGLQWLFKNDVGDFEGRGAFQTGSDIVESFPGFNYSVVDSANDIRAVLQALATDERLEVLSSPSLMVLDNRTAELRVGDQVPIRTTQSQSTVDEDSPIISNISFRDTGVLLSVTPRVNSGGLVTMEIFQEVSEVSSRSSVSDVVAPTISTRDITSTVAVQSGETIVLGGLIRETNRDGTTGVPVLKDLPVIGGLFRTTSQSSERTELIVLLTPTVASDSDDAREITEEFRRRLQGLDESLEQYGVQGGGAPEAERTREAPE